MIITKEIDAKLNDTTMTWGNPIFIDARTKPIELFGFYDGYDRVPHEIAKNTNEGVDRIAHYSCGCRMRFRTNSDYIVVRAELGIKEDVFTMPRVATQGFDMYFYKDGKYTFKGSFCANQGDKPYEEARIKLDNFDDKDVVINLPIVSQIKSLYIALREGSYLESPSKYINEKPVICYGSSIVQGIGAGRPGSLYTSELSRELDMNIVNLGFGGAAKAEKVIMEYMAGLDMCAFIYDYDHNAPSPTYLNQTHYEGYRIIREKNPNIPIIMASKPDYHFGDVETNEHRRQIILSTYNRAKENSDNNVYFVDGSKFYPEEIRNACSVDGCHPNDVGFLFMAKDFAKALKTALKI